jgi:hypothetical protein
VLTDDLAALEIRLAALQPKALSAFVQSDNAAIIAGKHDCWLIMQRCLEYFWQET